ncbi:uncharacterized protein Z519_00176 [Cladophialophora bantiana CBS 173.52]|uniref:Uncharacterized protein n=1 Tax=Cladophialophora bantiana (strain ATCC 10958 / CBS 173.52 / CDC B-1940 / NIH 8579) TaxID=1442370 RepID=A0A0D2I5K8_CLAB1|nr:uncharacterized protein Z519_00176 [Cladophialophora bantiana CBS 173.52]KIW98515.1 hypothetical protein Z519_00176 [Cladophialophora bantiana CBS 173.52]
MAGSGFKPHPGGSNIPPAACHSFNSVTSPTRGLKYLTLPEGSRESKYCAKNFQHTLQTKEQPNIRIFGQSKRQLEFSSSERRNSKRERLFDFSNTRKSLVWRRVRMCRTKRSNNYTTVVSTTTQTLPRPMVAGPEYGSAANGHPRKSNNDDCNGAYGNGVSRRRSCSYGCADCHGGRRGHHRSAICPVGLLISGMTQTMRSLQVMNEQEKIVEEQKGMEKGPRRVANSDDGKESASPHDTDGESETRSECEESATLARRKYEQHSEKPQRWKELA